MQSRMRVSSKSPMSLRTPIDSKKGSIHSSIANTQKKLQTIKKPGKKTNLGLQNYMSSNT
jgi:hypothetical protein